VQGVQTHQLLVQQEQAESGTQNRAEKTLQVVQEAHYP